MGKTKPSDPGYLFKILQSQPLTIRYLVSRPPSTLAGHVRQWLSNIHVR